MGIELSPGSGWVMAAFGLYLVGIFAFGIISHRFLTRGSFVNEYFLGNRGLGAWVLALTVAATAISGGTFMGFPSLIYTNGWIMSVWIASYMAVPLTAMVVMGKRINQVARISGSVTVPDVLRDRFNFPILGIVSTLMILLFVCFNLVAQFKAGGLVLKEAMRVMPPSAELLGTEIVQDHTLLLHFTTGDMKTPFPSESARFLADKTQIDDEKREAVVHFDMNGKEVIKRVKFPADRVTLPVIGWKVEKGYMLGLFLFAFTVIAYTTYGGFWAVTMTDVFEGFVMLFGVILLAILAIQHVPIAPSGATGLPAATEILMAQDPNLVMGPGPNAFLPIGMAFSFFLMWSLSSAGQPSGMVRLMSFKDSASLRRAVMLVGVFYAITYISLIIIFICARAIYPTEYQREMGSEGEPDSIMPAMVRTVAPTNFIAGLLLAAPYAAIMSTVAAFLLMISSSLVRDLWQRTFNPNASQRNMRILSYSATAIVGLIVMVGAMNPPGFLQYIIVFTGTGQSCSFLMPMLCTLFWRRATGPGVLCGMLGGFSTVISLYVLGWIDNRTQDDPSNVFQSMLGWLPGWGQKRSDPFAPMTPFGFDPLVWGFMASITMTVLVSLRGKPNSEQVRKYFPE